MFIYNAQIDISLRKNILDVQGKTVENALHTMEYHNIRNVRIGKYVELTVESESEESAYQIVDEASRKLIANPIIEDYKIKIIKQ